MVVIGPSQTEVGTISSDTQLFGNYWYATTVCNTRNARPARRNLGIVPSARRSGDQLSISSDTQVCGN